MKSKKIFTLISASAGIALAMPQSAFAAGVSFGAIANNFANSFNSVGSAVQTFCWMMAFVIAAAACFKFAAYARDTDREKITTPFLYLFVAALFFAVPMVLDSSVISVWGSNTTITQSSHNSSILP